MAQISYKASLTYQGSARPTTCSPSYTVYYLAYVGVHLDMGVGGSASAKASVRELHPDTGTQNRTTGLPEAEAHDDLTNSHRSLQFIDPNLWSDNGDGTYTVIVATLEHSNLSASDTYDIGSPGAEYAEDSVSAFAIEGYGRFSVEFKP